MKNSLLNTLKLYGRTLHLVYQADALLSMWVIALTLLRALAPAATLYVGKLLIDAVALSLSGVQHFDLWHGFMPLVALQAGVLACSAVATHVAQACTEVLAEALNRHCTALILHKTTRLEIPRFEDPEVHNAIRLAMQEVNMRPLSALIQALTFLQTLLTLASLAALLMVLGGMVLLLMVAAAIPLGWVSFKFNKASLDVDVAFTESARTQSYLASTMVSDQSAKELRVFPITQHLMDQWQIHHHLYRQAFVKLVRNRTFAHSITSLLSTLFSAGGTLLILQRVMERAITVGDFTFLTGGLIQVQGQFTALAGFFAKSHENMLYMKHFFDFLDLQNQDPDQGNIWNEPIEDIEFDEVCFAYPMTHRTVLHKVSFRIKRGDLLAIVGENGAGKSTLIKLLTCLYKPTSGTIRFNGKDIRPFSTQTLQHHISVLFQDFGQYHISAAENIQAGSNGNLQNVQKAAERSGAYGFLKTLPRGLENTLGRTFKGGVQLSGGQWQRIALARLYHKPASLWILDEPTSALDVHAESEILHGLQTEKNQRITVLITHRMNTARHANHILVLEQGQIVESGNHSELMGTEGRYAAMYNTQAASFHDSMTILETKCG